MHCLFFLQHLCKLEKNFKYCKKMTKKSYISWNVERDSPTDRTKTYEWHSSVKLHELYLMHCLFFLQHLCKLEKNFKYCKKMTKKSYISWNFERDSPTHRTKTYKPQPWIELDELYPIDYSLVHTSASNGSKIAKQSWKPTILQKNLWRFAHRLDQNLWMTPTDRTRRLLSTAYRFSSIAS